MGAVGWLFTIIWFFVLLLLAWPIGFIAGFFYVLLSPFTVCCTCMRTITDFIMKGVNLPRTVAGYMVAGKSCSDI